VPGPWGKCISLGIRSFATTSRSSASRPSCGRTRSFVSASSGKASERASALNHAHIARVYDVLEEKGELLLVMEYVEGSTLRQRLKEPLRTREFLETAIQWGEALAAAHQKGILHGDIKPENIMLTPEHQV
jgi:serine/threonine protein kinase